MHALEPGLFQTEQLGSPRVRKLLQQGWKDAPLKVKSEFGEEYAKECELYISGTTSQQTRGVGPVLG